MKKYIALFLMLIAAFSLAASGSGEAAQDDGSVLIGVSKLLSHAALDAVEVGMQDYLATTDIPVRYDFQNANGDISTAASIAQQFDSEKCDVVLGIGTASAQALANVFTDIPVLFAAVTDPVDAGLVATNEGTPGTNVCGVSDMNPVEEQIALLHEITGATRIGNVYSSGEQNGVVLMEQAKAACDKLGLELVTAAVSNSSEVRMALQSIIDRVDAVYIATDNNVISAIATIDDVCNQAGIPLMSADPSGIDGLDCMIAWGFNYYSIGTAAGKLIEDIVVNGADPGAQGTVFLTDPADFELWFNLDTAAKLGYTIPQEYLDTAAVIIENGVKTER